MQLNRAFNYQVNMMTYGIPKTTAYKLVNQGWLYPFHLSGRTDDRVREIEAMAVSHEKRSSPNSGEDGALIDLDLGDGDVE